MSIIKRIISALTVFTMVQGAVSVLTAVQADALFENAEIIYVAPGGNDKNSGTEKKPLATFEGARNMVRQIDTDKDIYVVFRGGTYNVRETVELNNQDSGRNGKRVIYTSYPEENAVFSGGEKISGWKPYKDGIFVADVPGLENFRELYADGKRQTRAATKFISGLGFDENQTALIVLTSDLPSYIKNQDCLETMNTYNWRQYWLPVERVFREGNYTKIYYDKDEIQTYTSRFNFEWSGKSYIKLENALEFLDEDGEWYFDKYEKKLYYKPEQGMNINSAEIYVPVIEKFIDIRGKSVDDPVKNLEIQNLTFLYAGWTYPSEGGYCSVQATSVVRENGGAYAEMTPGHIEVNYARDIKFSGNTMAHLAAVALNAENAVFDSFVSANVFYDIGASAVTLGSTKHDNSVRCVEIPDNVVVDSNVIRYAGMGYYGAPGIAYYFTTNSKILHNDIQNVPYSGISLGWGWRETPYQHDNLVGYNKIGNVNTKVVDGSPIYSLGSNENSGYVGNHVFGINAPFNSGALYHDQNSRGFDDYDNVIDSENPSFLFYNLNDNDEITIRDTYTNTLNIINYKHEGKDIKVYNIHYVKNDEWPERAREIMDFAGPEEKYRAEIYKKLEAVERSISVKKPIIRALGVGYVEANLFYPVSQDVADKADLKTPYAEENGNVVFDAIDINGGYTGYDESKKAFVAVLGNKSWVGDYVSRGALTIQSCQYNIENSDKLTGKPRVGYKVHFNTPGRYNVFVRAKASGELADAMSVYLNSTEVGKLSIHKGFSWCGKSSAGDMTVDIPSAGEYEIAFETMSDIYLDRIWLSIKPPEELFDGSTAQGEISSKRYSDTISYVDVPLKLSGDKLPPVLGKRENIALKKPATASSYMGQSTGYLPANAVNGRINDDWLTEETKENPWWQVDLEKEYKITEIGLVFRTSADQPVTRRNFEVLASNDESFNVYTKFYSSGDKVVGFKEELSIPVESEESYRYIRVRKTLPEAMGIAECRVYSEETVKLKPAGVWFSSEKDGKYGTQMAVDNDTSTYWSDGFKKDYRVIFRNDSGSAISMVKLHMRSDVNIPALYEDFEIRASDDYNFENYVVLCDNFLRRGNAISATASDPNSYKYIMIIKKKGFIGVSEIELFTRGTALDE